MHFFPREISIYGVYVSPYLPCGVVALLLASATVQLFNRHRLSRFFAYPPLVYLALVVIYGGLLSIWIFPG